MCMQSVALCSKQNRNTRMLSVIDYTHMSGVRFPQNLLAGRCLCVLPPSPQSEMQRFKRRKSWSSSPAEKKKKEAGVRLTFLLSRSQSFTHSHAHTLTHRHSHTVSSMSAASQQQVSEDRGHLCAGPPPPFLLRLWPPLLGERLAVKSEPTACLSAPMSTPPRHKIPLMKIHLLWHHDLPPIYHPYTS